MSVRAPLLLATGLLTAVLAVGCGSDDDTTTATAESSSTPQPAEPSEVQQIHPDVESVELKADDDGTFSAVVTISSPYDSPDRYADGWRVLDPEGELLGEMELGHDHAAEQPFTRTQSGLEIAEGTESVTVEGRDSVNGYGGTTVDVAVPTP